MGKHRMLNTENHKSHASVPAPLAKKTSKSFLSGARDTLSLVLKAGGPGFCQFAVTSACNANCGFCNFARDRFPKKHWTFVDPEKGKRALSILHREGIRYLVFTGGEPTMHPDLASFVRHAADLGMKVMVVSNAGLLKPKAIHALAEAGLSSFIISVDAATRETHEQNRGLPGVCERIKEANAILKRIKLHATASVTMSRLVDYESLPDFLRSLGFDCAVFSYPLKHLPSNFRGFADSPLVDYDKEELCAAYEQVKRLKKRFHVVNPRLSLEEMQRFVRGERQQYSCLAGYRFFFLDWDLMLWRCHNWHEPMCAIEEFDSSKLIRDGCTRCMINCYRDSSLMQHVAVSVHDAYQSVREGKLLAAAQALTRKSNLDSLRAVMEQLPWILRF